VKEEVRKEDNSACISHAARSRKRRRRIMPESTKQLEEDNSASTNHFKAERERRAILPASTMKEELGKEDDSACISHVYRGGGGGREFCCCCFNIQEESPYALYLAHCHTTEIN
jgi:hypothetical protein